MEQITAKAPAKINWYLAVKRRRADGYHEIETVLQTIPLYDTLTFVRTEDSAIRLDVTGQTAGSVPSDASNLVYRAAELLGVSGLHITLHKNIPAQAGLGGGSSDAACTLKVLNELYQLGHTQQELAKIALNLGADVPFFLYGGACIARGIGEEIEPLPPVTKYKIQIQKPAKSLSTGEIYRLADTFPKVPHPTLEEFLQEFRQDGNPEKLLYNELESASIALCPEIAQLKDALMQQGALGALMSGSGSAVFGLFETNSADFKNV